jgi:hypothetical protein
MMHIERCTAVVKQSDQPPFTLVVDTWPQLTSALSTMLCTTYPSFLRPDAELVTTCSHLCRVQHVQHVVPETYSTAIEFYLEGQVPMKNHSLTHSMSCKRHRSQLCKSLFNHNPFLAGESLSIQTEALRANGKQSTTPDTDFFTPAALASQSKCFCDAVPWLAFSPDSATPDEASVTPANILASLKSLHDALVALSHEKATTSDHCSHTCVAGSFPDALANACRENSAPNSSSLAHALRVDSAPQSSALERLLGHRISSSDGGSTSGTAPVATAGSLLEFTPEVAAGALAVAAHMQCRSPVPARPATAPPGRQSLVELGPAATWLGGGDSVLSEGWGGEGVARIHDTLPVEVGGPSGFSGPLGAVSGFSSALPGLGCPNSGISGTLPFGPNETVSMSGRLSRQSSVRPLVWLSHGASEHCCILVGVICLHFHCSGLCLQKHAGS